MSIIEKAVGALGKGDDTKKNRGAKKSQKDSSQATTVQRASTDTDTEAVDPSSSAEELAPSRERQEPVLRKEPTARQDFESRDTFEFDGGYDGSPTIEGNFLKLNFEDLRQLGILTPAVPRSTIAEEYRTIKRPLLTNIAGDDMAPPIKHGNLIMVTSALEGDGKTFNSICLAISIAMEQDKTVLFVDADTAKAEAGRLLGIPSDCPGLIDVLEDSQVSLDDVILQTSIDKLQVLPAGDLHTHANELLASEKMRQLMIMLSEQDPDRVIVFDSPPLLLTTEASVLASFMGQIVFVVSADGTPQHAVTQAIEHIGEDKMVGMVLNRARRRSGFYNYTYGEVYGYGRDRENDSESG